VTVETTDTVDPFAAAQVTAESASAPANVQPTSAPAPDPFVGSADEEDPFATSSDYRGSFSPSPPLDALTGRVLVMIPRSFDPEAKDPLNPGETREQYTIDLTVLTGGRMAWYYTAKGDAEKGTEDEVKEFVVEDVSPATPYTNSNHWIPQGNIISKLKDTHAAGRPFLGLVARGPQKTDRDKGVTAAQIQKQYADWVGRGRQGPAPKFSWLMIDPTPEQRAVAIAWWRENGKSIAPINTSTAPKR
jgi:hypothetical protein